MRQQDILQRFLFENTDIRGELIHLETVIQALLERHPYPAQILDIIGQSLAAVGLLSASIKYEGSLILQTHTDVAINLLVAQSDEKLHLRGLAQWDKETSIENLQLGSGQLVITLIPKQLSERYQGIVALSYGNLSQALEEYFAQSEQLATKIILVTDGAKKAAGILLQKMPSKDEQSWQYWEHVTTLLATLSPKERVSLSNEEILYRLFHQEEVRLFEAEPVSFQCGCSVQNMEKAILTFGQQEIEHILTEKQVVDVTCEFCNRSYSFDQVDIARIFHEGTEAAPH